METTAGTATAACCLLETAGTATAACCLFEAAGTGLWALGCRLCCLQLR